MCCSDYLKKKDKSADKYMRHPKVAWMDGPKCKFSQTVHVNDQMVILIRVCMDVADNFQLH